MMTATLGLTELTAEDIMSPDVMCVPKNMSLRAAANLLVQSRISGAPVLDEQSRCIGVLSLRDLVEWLDKGDRAAKREPTSSTCVCSDWEMVDADKMPTDEVYRYMTADVVTATPETPIGELAQTMLDAQIHRLIVSDYLGRVKGVVSTTDVLAALANYCRQ